MHLNDTHSHLAPIRDQALVLGGLRTWVDMGGMARIKSRVDRIRKGAGHSILLHAGDAVQGTLYFTRYLGRADMAALNLLGVEAMTVGNHEFDKGPGLLAALADMADFPLLGANIDRTREPRLAGRVRDYVVRDVGGEQVAVIGLLTPETAFLSRPGDTLRFGDVCTTARRVVATLRSRGVNKVIALTHEGIVQDRELARSVDGIDLIVGGHSHTLPGGMEDFGLVSGGLYPERILSPDGSPVYIVQAWSGSRALGVVRAAFDRAGEIVEIEGTPVLLLGDIFKRKDASGSRVPVDLKTRQEILETVDANPELEVVPEDAAMLALLAPYTDGIRDMTSEVVGRIAEDLPHVRIPGQDRYGPRPECPNGSLVAPLVAESMVWKANANGLDADLALVNGGGIRTSLERGKLTVGDVYTLLPFDNTLVVLGLSGAEVRAALEQGVDKALRGSSGAFPYPGHARCRIDLSAPQGRRIADMEIENGPGTWLSLDPAGTYRVVVSSYLAGGGDGYSVLARAPGYRCDTGFVDAEAFLDYVENKGEVNRRDVPGGIVVVGR
jgi:5'-nucleotidase